MEAGVRSGLQTAPAGRVCGVAARARGGLRKGAMAACCAGALSKAKGVPAPRAARLCFEGYSGTLLKGCVPSCGARVAASRLHACPRFLAGADPLSAAWPRHLRSARACVLGATELRPAGMASAGEYNRLPPKQYPPRARRETAEGKFWRKFGAPELVQCAGAVTHLEYCAAAPHSRIRAGAARAARKRGSLANFQAKLLELIL